MLDDIWRQQDFQEYPQERMFHLLGIITEDIKGSVQHHLAPLDLLKNAFSEVFELLRGGRDVCEHLISTCDTLTSKIWPNTPNNKWKGGSFTSMSLNNLRDRIILVGQR